MGAVFYLRCVFRDRALGMFQGPCFRDVLGAVFYLRKFQGPWLHATRVCVVYIRNENPTTSYAYPQ